MMCVGGVNCKAVFANELSNTQGKREGIESSSNEVKYTKDNILADLPTFSWNRSDDFDLHWFAGKEYLQTNKIEKALEEFKKLRELRLDNGVEDLHLFAAALLREAYQYSAKNKYEEALKLSLAAKEIAPDYPHNYYTLGRIYWHQNKLNLVRVLNEYVKGYFATFRGIRQQWYFFGNFYLTLLISIPLTFFVLFIVLFIKYGPQLFHDFSELISTNIPNVVKKGIFYLLVILPLFFSSGIIWLFVFWIILLWVYFNSKEKVFTSLFFIFLLLFPFFVKIASSFVILPKSNFIQSIVYSMDGTWDVEIFNKAIEQKPENLGNIYYWALLNKRVGRYKQAAAGYERVIELAPNQAETYNNLGNVYFAQGLTDKALGYYEKAIQISPKLASAHYNLSHIYRENFNLEKAKEKLQTAKDLDSGLINYYTGIHDSNFNRLLIDEPVSHKSILQNIFQNSTLRDKIAKGIWGKSMRGISLKKLPLASVIMFFILLIIYFYRRVYGFAHTCLRCGQVICSKCQGSMDEKEYCLPCIHVFIKKDGISAKTRISKIVQIRKFKRREGKISRFISFLVPGSGQIYLGQTLRGIVFVLISIFLLVNIFYWRGILIDPTDIHIGSYYGGYVFFILAVLTYYALIIRNIYKTN